MSSFGNGREGRLLITQTQLQPNMHVPDKKRLWRGLLVGPLYYLVGDVIM